MGVACCGGSGPGPQVPDVSYEDAVSFEQYGRSFMWAMTATTGMGFNIDPQTMLQTSARPPPAAFVDSSRSAVTNHRVAVVRDGSGGDLCASLALACLGLARSAGDVRGRLGS